MKSLVRVFVPVVLALSATTSMAYAQGANMPAVQPMDSTAADHSGHRPSAETMQRLQDGRIAMAKTALKLNDAQLQLWTPVEAAIRAQQAQRAKDRENGPQMRAGGTVAPTLADRLERNSARMVQHAESAKSFAVVFRPFYDSLSDSQKAVAGPLLAELNGRKHGHGNRWAAHHKPQSSQQ